MKICGHGLKYLINAMIHFKTTKVFLESPEEVFNSILNNMEYLYFSVRYYIPVPDTSSFVILLKLILKK